MEAALKNARDFAPEKVVAAKTLENDFLKWVFERLEEEGVQLPFDFPLRFRRKEVTLWMGVKGSGKSTLLDFVTVAAMAQGERAMVASFEMPWEDTHDKLCRQAFGGFYFDKRFLKKCTTEEERTNYLATARAQTIETHRWLAKSLWYYVHVGIARWRTLMDDMRWARRRLGITFFVVDNFMRLGISKEDYSQQAECMIAFAGLAMELDAHIVVVIHSTKETAKKSRNETTGNAASASGAHEIGDNAHNVVEVQRDDRKGKMVAELFDDLKVGALSQSEFDTKKAALDMKPDGKFLLHNQRKGDVQDGSKYLWFLWESQQYVDCPNGNPDHAPIRFVANAEKLPQPMELPTNEEMLNA
jgi:twinkle protein